MGLFEINSVQTFIVRYTGAEGAVGSGEADSFYYPLPKTHYPLPKGLVCRLLNADVDDCTVEVVVFAVKFNGSTHFDFDIA